MIIMSETLDSIIRVPCGLEQNFTGFSADFGTVSSLCHHKNVSCAQIHTYLNVDVNVTSDVNTGSDISRRCLYRLCQT